MMDLVSANLTLDLLLKIVLLFILIAFAGVVILLGVLVRDVDDAVKSAKESADSVGDAAESLASTFWIGIGAKKLFKKIKGGSDSE